MKESTVRYIKIDVKVTYPQCFCLMYNALVRQIRRGYTHKNYTINEQLSRPKAYIHITVTITNAKGTNRNASQSIPL